MHRAPPTCTCSRVFSRFLRDRRAPLSTREGEDRPPRSNMEESDLLKERLQAITEKHRIQEDIRKKKLELDQEKLKLQHLKKKALREQWLLQDSHNAVDCTQQQSLLSDQQQTRALQLRIHRIEMEVASLEREESMISTNESFILNRLKTVEKSPEEIIKEAHSSFVPEPLQVTTVIPDVPEFLSSPASEGSEPNTPRTILDVPLEELHQHTALKGSHDQLSDNEVEHLLGIATVHRQVKYQNYCQNSMTREEQSFSSHRDERDRHQAGHCDKHVLRRHTAEKEFSCSENWQRKPHSEHHSRNQESCYIRNEGRNKQTILKESHYKALDHHYCNQQDCHYSSYHARNCHSIQEGGSTSHHPSSIPRSSSRMNGSRSNGYHPLSSHDQEVVTAHQPQFSYTPRYIPPTDYISEEHYCYCLPSYKPNRQTENSHNRSTAQYSDPTYPHRVPSPLYQDDPPYTILNTLDTTEPITAIFMGFQTTRDDSRQVQEFEGSLKAELVIVEDNEDSKDSNIKEKKSHTHIRKGSTSSGTIGHMQGVGDRHTERQVGPGIRKIQKKQQSCCSLC